MKIYIDGKYLDKDEAGVSVFDHGLLYGDGVFEGIRAYGGKAFRLEAHIERLYEGARAILLEIPMSREEMVAAVTGTLEENNVSDGYVRLVVTRGAGTLGLDPASCKSPTVIIIAEQLTLYPEEFYQNGIEVVTASSRRVPADSLDPRVKSLNYLNNVLAKIEAAQAGCREAVMLNSHGYVAECTADNVFVVKRGVLLTPPPWHGALDGITMRAILEIASDMGIENRFSPLTRYDLYTADECFLTGTGAEVVPVARIDGRAIGEGAPGPMTREVMRGFDRLVRG